MGNKLFKRIAFIKKYFKILKDKNSVLFVLDEVGFGELNYLLFHNLKVLKI